MCGLIYVKRKDGRSAAKTVIKLYHKQRDRGFEGFGYVAIQDDQIVSYVRSPHEHEIMQKLRKETASEILFHHRYPTSGPNVEEMAHPLRVEHPELEHYYFIAHNGIIRNPETRREAHRKAGFTYKTELREALQSVITRKVYRSDRSKFNDSEALAVDTLLALEHGTPIQSYGAAAVIGLRVKGSKVVERFFYRNTWNPLYFFSNQAMITLTSHFRHKSESVPTLYIMELKGDGMVEHPAKMWPPSVYEGEQSQVSSYMAMPPLLSSPKEELLYGESLFLTHEELLIEASPMLPSEESEIKRSLQWNTPDELWDEYKKCTTALIHLEEAVEQLQGIVSKKGPTSDTNSSLTRLSMRISRCKKYQKNIESELISRELLDKSIEKIIEA